MPDRHTRSPSKARELPLTNKERRELVGLDPWGKPELDEAVWLPVGLTEAYPGGPDGPQGAPEPAPTPPALAPFAGGPPPPEMTPEEMAAKSRIGTAMSRAHARFTKRAEADLQRAVAGVLEEQRAEVTRRVARGDPGRLRGDTASWWDKAKWDKRLMDVLKAHYQRTYAEVGTIVPAVFGKVTAKAAPVPTTTDLVYDDDGRVVRIVELHG